MFAFSILSLALGAGMYTLTLIGFVILLGSLSLFPALEGYLKDRSNHFEIHLELKSNKHLVNFVSTIRRLGLVIDDIEKNRAYSDSGLSVYSIALSIESEQLKKYKVRTIVFAGVTVYGQDYQDEKGKMLKYIGDKFSKEGAEIITAIIEKPVETDLETVQRGIKTLSTQ